ncbi:hypothetical protein K402DRAFT_211133 [Aulographum hederae CBS 113979]|uniref:Uncharacterized protein n=1 Tax=Aulographum hederae CBS 113979 TaxID=1176131 RepID=A0A6G1GMQ9_9PEZI|nr:hypothetical protein K402DRAFT_211133 [Aulographum hederae CBS 113979]
MNAGTPPTISPPPRPSYCMYQDGLGTGDKRRDTTQKASRTCLLLSRSSTTVQRFEEAFELRSSVRRADHDTAEEYCARQYKAVPGEAGWGRQRTLMEDFGNLIVHPDRSIHGFDCDVVPGQSISIRAAVPGEIPSVQAGCFWLRYGARGGGKLWVERWVVGGTGWGGQLIRRWEKPKSSVTGLRCY